MGGGSSVNRVGNFCTSEEGVRSRFVLAVEGAVELARGVCLEDLASSSSSSESESSMLSASSSSASSSRGSSREASASSIRRLFSCSTSTLTLSPSPSTSSHTRFLSIVTGTFLAKRSLLSSGFRSSSLFLLNRISRLRPSLAFFCAKCRLCLRNLFSVLKGKLALGEGFTLFLDPIPAGDDLWNDNKFLSFGSFGGRSL